jgi:hypothetical protein
MPLSYDQQERIKEKLSPLLRSSCNVCGGRSWELHNEVAMHPLFDIQYKMPINGQFVPIVLVTCASCSNTLSFNAIKLGVL